MGLTREGSALCHHHRHFKDDDRHRPCHYHQRHPFHHCHYHILYDDDLNNDDDDNDNDNDDLNDE